MASNERNTEHYGAGQSGYGAGRDADPAMGPNFRNQTSANRSEEDGAGMHTDDRFTGRGGEGYWEDRSQRVERTNYGEPSGAMGYRGGNLGQGGHRGKGPVGYTRSDDRIHETVCEALADDDYVDATHIEVVVKNGEVMLTGTVEDRRQKKRAEDLIEHMPGVKDVQNQLRCRSLMGNRETSSAVGIQETETSPKHRA